MCIIIRQSDPVDIVTSGNEAYELVKGQSSQGRISTTQPATATDEYVVPSLLPLIGDDDGTQKPPAVCVTEKTVYEHIN